MNGTSSGRTSAPGSSSTTACSMTFCSSRTFPGQDRKSTRLNSSHLVISYAVFCLKKQHNFRLDGVLPTILCFLLCDGPPTEYVDTPDYQANTPPDDTLLRHPDLPYADHALLRPHL